jgi:putative acetyltransferase
MAGDFEVRRGGLDDVDGIAEAHLDSIRSLGPRYYGPEIVRAWGAHVRRQLYVSAMASGEHFFVAIDDTRQVLGFSCHHVDGPTHGTAVYVRGSAVRRGIGSALFRTAEASAIAAGAAAIEIASSLAAVEFYRANGFAELGRGAHVLPSGRAMACVFMRKLLPRITNHGGTETPR